MLRTLLVALLRWIQTVLEPGEDEYNTEGKVDLPWDNWYHQIFYRSNECDDMDAVVSVGHKTDRCLPVFLKDKRESFKGIHVWPIPYPLTNFGTLYTHDYTHHPVCHYQVRGLKNSNT